MRKRIAGLVVIAMFTISATFANSPETVNSKVLSSFSQEFAKATEVNWEKTETYYKATFKMNDQYMFAYYTNNGEIIGLSRNIFTSQLPLNLQSQLKKDYSDYWISELTEFAVNGETIYYAVLENGNQKVSVKSGDSREWSVLKKAKKS